MKPPKFENYHLFGNAGPNTFERARALKKRSTKAEILLWQQLRNRKLNGLKFRRQHPFDFYILDFYCPVNKLVIEVDGKIHLKPDQIEYDKKRTLHLEQRGLKIIRFQNTDVINNMETVLDEIKKACDKLQS